jgi:hypothetical protein
LARTFDARYLKSRIKTSSLVCVPRESASCLPSREKSNQKIWSALKSVNFFGGPPSSGSDQMLETPLIVSMYLRARPVWRPAQTGGAGDALRDIEYLDGIATREGDDRNLEGPNDRRAKIAARYLPALRSVV